MPPRPVFHFRLIESDDFLDDFAVRNTWTPFEAACLIRGFEPGDPLQKPVTVGIPLSSAISQENLDAHDPTDLEAERDLLNIMHSIIEKWGQQPAPSDEIVHWALSKGLVREGRFAARALGRLDEHNRINEETALLRAENTRLKSQNDQLQRDLQERKTSNDGRGQHHAEKRDAILGFVIRELLANCGDEDLSRLMKGHDFNATGLADFIEKVREDIGMPSGDTQGFAHRAIVQTLQQVSKAVRDIRTTD